MPRRKPLVKEQAEQSLLMIDWAAQSKFVRLALACVMVLSTFVAPPGPSASHDPAALALAEVERHAALAATDVDEGHIHEDERHAGHAHGHDPTDHSHDIPAPIYSNGHVRLDIGRSWHAVAPLPHEHGPSVGVDRPPRA